MAHTLTTVITLNNHHHNDHHTIIIIIIIITIIIMITITIIIIIIIIIIINDDNDAVQSLPSSNLPLLPGWLAPSGHFNRNTKHGDNSFLPGNKSRPKTNSNLTFIPGFFSSINFFIPYGNIFLKKKH